MISKYTLIGLVVILSGCSTMSCIKKCGIFPDGCMSWCEKKQIAVEYCGSEKSVKEYNWNNIKCER